MATTERNLKYSSQHDPIYCSLDSVTNWAVKGDLSLKDDLQQDETERVKKFHLLIRDVGKRFARCRDLNRFGWFLRQEGNGHDKRFHFHFLLTRDGLGEAAAETMCRYMERQWLKIARSRANIVPWDCLRGDLGIWYVTKKERYSLPHSTYFGGADCHWKMSHTLYDKLRRRTEKNDTE